MGGRKPVGKELGEAWRYDTLGYTFAFSVIGFAGVGYLLDRWLHTTPIITIVGTLTGAGLAFCWVYAKVRADQARYDAERAAKAARPAPPPDEDGG
jgi:F0F1-type ATP synthase assembly protein I